MRGEKSAGYSLMSAIILISGLALIFLGVIVTSGKINEGDADKLMVVIAAALIIISGILEIITSILSLKRRKGSVNPNRLIALGRTEVVLGIIYCVLSLVNGIIIWRLVALIIAGIVIPILYLAASRRRIRKPRRRVIHEVRR